MFLIFLILLLPLHPHSNSITGLASWYSTEACTYNPNPRCPTASGDSLYELERSGTHFAASWEFEFGTRLRVTNIENQKSVIVTVLDRGPTRKLNRLIDLSLSAFSAISDRRTGIISVTIEEII